MSALLLLLLLLIGQFIGNGPAQLLQPVCECKCECVIINRLLPDWELVTRVAATAHYPLQLLWSHYWSRRAIIVYYLLTQISLSLSPFLSSFLASLGFPNYHHGSSKHTHTHTVLHTILPGIPSLVFMLALCVYECLRAPNFFVFFLSLNLLPSTTTKILLIDRILFFLLPPFFSSLLLNTTLVVYIK